MKLTMTTPASSFVATRDLILKHRANYERAIREFAWPRQERFNWALDYFDTMSFIAVGKGYEPLQGYQPLRSWQGAIESAVATLTGYQQVALAVVASIGVGVLVASLASFAALVARHPRRLGVAGWLLLFHAA